MTILQSNREAIDMAQSDEALVRRCLAGDVGGWQELYHLCHGPLVSTVRGGLGFRAHDLDLVEELAAQVWYLLVDRNAALLGTFRAEHGCRLSTFIAAIAKNLVRNSLRSERRRRARESSAGAQRVDNDSGGAAPLDVVSDEFRQTLTQREEGYFTWCITPGEPGSKTFSGNENADHQLRYRLRKKVHDFFEDAP